MAVNLRDTAAAAASLALKMGSTAADAIVFMAELGEKLPFLEPVLGTILAIREKVEAVESNGEELAALEERCTYITACVIEHHSRTPTSEMDVTPLKTCVEEVEAFVERCGRNSWRARFVRFLKASDDKDEIAGLNARVDRLTGDLGLAGIVIVENKVDNLKTILAAMDESHTAKQEQILASQVSSRRRQQSSKMRQMSLKKRQEEIAERLPKRPGKLAKVPKDTPTSKSWHVERRRVMEDTFEALMEDGGPRLVGLVGDSGSGKTTAASDIVRSPKVREAFCDGIVWMSINKGADTRLPSLMMQLATKVYEDIGGSVGRAPGKSEDGAAYIKRRMQEGHVGKGLKCLVVADNVWEMEVVLKLVETGMWVLLSTRDDEMVKGAQGDVVGVHKLSTTDAKSVLRSAAEIPTGVDLPDNAVDLIDLCGRVPMDLAFVGRWSTVRKMRQRQSWSDAAEKIRTEIDKVQAESGSDGIWNTHARRRKAILRAGFDDLAVASDDMRVPRLYLSLAIMPDGHAFTVKDAAVLLCDMAPNAEETTSTSGVLETLERWTVVRLTEGTYHMHDAHSSFARESLMDRGDVRRPALKRWVGYISSLDALRSISAVVLKEQWLAVKRVGGDGWDESRPYATALAGMGETDPLLRQSVEAMGWFEEEQGDWKAARNTWRRLLEIEQREFGSDHSILLNTLGSLADCADQLGHDIEAAEWRRKGQETFMLAMARMQLQLHADRVEEPVDNCAMQEVGYHISTWAPDDETQEAMLRSMLASQEVKLGHEDIGVASTMHALGVCLFDAGCLQEAEKLLRRCLAIWETTLDNDDVDVANTLHELGLCVRDAGRLQEAEGLLGRCLVIEELALGSDSEAVASTLFSLGGCARTAGRLQKAEQVLRRSLAIRESTLGKDDMVVASTLYELGICVRDAGRLQEAEGLLGRCLAIEELALGSDSKSVACTLLSLGECVRTEGRLQKAEQFLRRSLAILETTRSQEDMNLPYALYQLGTCLCNAERWEEADEFLRRCLVIEEAELGPEDVRVASTLYQLGVSARNAGRLKEAEKILKRCLAIRETAVGTEDLIVSDTLHQLGVCIYSAGRLEEGEALLRRCLAIEEVKLGPEDVGLSRTLYQLGVSAQDAGRLKEAEKLLRRCLVIEETTMGREDVHVARTLHALRKCFRTTDQLEEADESLRRCLVTKDTKLGSEDVGLASTLHELDI